MLTGRKKSNRIVLITVYDLQGVDKLIYTAMTKKAITICFQAHKEQLDKSGIPYVFHPYHLAEQMTDEITVTVALLHDVVEDTEFMLEDIQAFGFPEAVITALALLTHDANVPYFDYISNIKSNPVACKVKLADLRHNSDTTRLEAVDSKALARVEKYRKAMAILEA